MSNRDIAYSNAWSKWVMANYETLVAFVYMPLLFLIARHSLDKPKKIVDVGAGTGHLLALCQRMFPNSVSIGVEINEAFSAIQATTTCAEVLTGNAQHLPDAAQEADVIIATAVPHLLSEKDLGLFLDSAKTRLSDEGILVLSVDDPDRMRAATQSCPKESVDGETRIDTSWDGATEFSFIRSAASYQRIFESHGFSVAEKLETQDAEGNKRYLQFVLCVGW